MAKKKAIQNPAADGEFNLDIGMLSLEQINLILNHLPVEISFVDESDTVRYYSKGKGERIFSRSLAVIGRRVQDCHPSKSIHLVNEILDSFRAGTKDVAEFWIQQGERTVHIRYFPVRSKEGEYRGCIEVTQDITNIKKIKGEKRLL